MQTICKNNFSALSINFNKSPSFVDSHMQKLRKAMQSRQAKLITAFFMALALLAVSQGVFAFT
ncbi:TPA: conjugative transfer protein TraE, partial [Enterobacter cloacae]|nr:conjugative transfer protein TraE [Enterobacter cloacae]